MTDDIYERLKTGTASPVKPIRKLGTLALGVVETTPVVWKGRLLRFEWVRNWNWGGNERSVGYYHFVDMETGEATPPFAVDHSFGCCYAEDGKMYVHGTRGPGGGNVLDWFVSEDLIHWETGEAVRLDPDFRFYNTSVCKCPEGYVMAMELGGSRPEVGVNFTSFFARSKDLIHWTVLPTDRYVYDTGRYTACPVIRWFEGWFYIVQLESAPLHRWIPYIFRTKDLEHFECAPRNPFLMFSDEDKQVVHPENFTPEKLERIRTAVNCNNSDVDFCEYNGKTVILYSWGNQLGREFLAQAEYDGGLQEMLESFFAD